MEFKRDMELVIAFLAGYFFCAVWMGVWTWLIMQ
jgi:hypothetical protein